MADKKISALTSATTPLAGTEVLPIVQSGSTVKVATNDLTVKNIRSNATTGILQVAGPAAGATRTMTTPDANFTAARTDAAQTLTGNQTVSNGDVRVDTTEKGLVQTATNGDLLVASNGTGIIRSNGNGARWYGDLADNVAVTYWSTATAGSSKNLATVYASDNASSFGRCLVTVTATNGDANFGYSMACSVREVLWTKYGGAMNIIKDTELSNNQASINAGVINVTLATAVTANASADLFTISATPTITGSVGGTNAALEIKIENLCSLQIPTIAFL